MPFLPPCRTSYLVGGCRPNPQAAARPSRRPTDRGRGASRRHPWRSTPPCGDERRRSRVRRRSRARRRGGARFRAHRRRHHPASLAHAAARPGRLPHARGRRRGALRRQGQEPEARVASYTRAAGHSNRIARMIAATASMVFVSTATETEALLLEANYIKQMRPALQRADAGRQVVPLHPADRRPPGAADRQASRGAAPARATISGPFASVPAVNRTLQRAAARLPAALLHGLAISRTAPGPACSTRSSAAPAPARTRCRTSDYAALVGEARGFLSGKSRAVRDRLARRHGAGRRDAGVRARRTAARPHRGALGHPGHAGHQSQDGRGGGRLRRRRGGRAVRGRGVLLPHLPELGQPGLLPARRPDPRRRARCSAPFWRSSTSTSRRRG